MRIDERAFPGSAARTFVMLRGHRVDWAGWYGMQIFGQCQGKMWFWLNMQKLNTSHLISRAQIFHKSKSKSAQLSKHEL